MALSSYLWLSFQMTVTELAQRERRGGEDIYVSHPNDRNPPPKPSLLSCCCHIFTLSSNSCSTSLTLILTVITASLLIGCSNRGQHVHNVQCLNICTFTLFCVCEQFHIHLGGLVLLWELTRRFSEIVVEHNIDGLVSHSQGSLNE